jgi:hypothetical protein
MWEMRGLMMPRIAQAQAYYFRSESNTVKSYQNIGEDSGIASYEYGVDWIRIWFKKGGSYKYPSSMIGAAHLRAMKRRADSGKGLNTYINTHREVKEGCR